MFSKASLSLAQEILQAAQIGSRSLNLLHLNPVVLGKEKASSWLLKVVEQKDAHFMSFPMRGSMAYLLLFWVLPWSFRWASIPLG